VGPGSSGVDRASPSEKDRHSHRAEAGIPTAKSKIVAPFPSLPRLLTVKEVAEILQLSPRTVWRMIHAERLPVVRIRRAVRVHPAVVGALIEGH